ncbi:hypothetical protein EDC65_1199 [Stella humosa]|uniref:Uncharacterized protein n=1 Tax=Stella humosa TaxID=94 RepID=A0A3N1M849_9PROT|nr:hypothetical protein [Stella humosa]ROQ02012.1 hypothetical protein EDC65_1199 [Stella humosa]BBK32401.1 hypothetical protein STHU_30350 [Stella humosa]
MPRNDSRLQLSRRSFLGLAGASIVHAALPGRARAAAATEIRGVNFAFVDVDRAKVATCNTKGRNASIGGRGFLKRYQEAGVRDAVRASLGRLRESGVTAIRHNLWFIGGDRAPQDVFRVADAGLAADRMGQFAQDMRRAGLEQLFLALSPVGESVPGCRKVEWGDCFRPEGTQAAMGFLTQVANAAAGPALYVDGFNEGVPSEALKPPVRAAMMEYLGTCLATIAALRPAPRIVVSTQGNRADERVAILDQVLRRTGVRLDVLDIHVYRGRGTGPDGGTLARFRDFAAARGARLLVGEIQADDGLIGRVRQALGRGDGRDPLGYFPWPLADAATGCHVDMDVPDMIGTLRRMRPPGG